ncbi:hypothetical protein MPER_12254, partial [Moniliophthora perniciosa FA553]
MANTVEYRKLGATGLRVSVPIIGAMSFVSPEWMLWFLDEEKSLPILKAAWDRGINTIDTANIYSNGVSEQIVAKFIEKYKIPRKQIIIATKCFGTVYNTPAGSGGQPTPEIPEYINQHGLSRAAIFNAVEASLERLKTSYIDLLQIHRHDPDVPAEEIMKALHDLVQSGKVRYIGASSMRTWQFAHLNAVAEKHGWTKFVSMQNEYSLLYREEEREMIPYSGGQLCRPIGVESQRSETLKGSPWARVPTEADKEIVKRVEEVAKKRGKTMTQVALAW